MMMLLRKLAGFFAGRFLKIAQVILGIFMVLMGSWFVLAPVTQQFLSKQEELQETPFLWLIIPVGIIQILIGLSMLRPLFLPPSKG